LAGGAPAVTSAVVPARAEQVVKVKAPATAAEIKEKIEKLSGGQAHNVRVIFGANASLWVSMKVPSTAVGEGLARRVLDMPELTPYRVSLEMPVGR
jgi:hypothetical protein